MGYSDTKITCFVKHTAQGLAVKDKPLHIPRDKRTQTAAYECKNHDHSQHTLKGLMPALFGKVCRSNRYKHIKYPVIQR